MGFRVYDKKKKKFVQNNIFLTQDGELVESKKSLFGNRLTFVDQNRYVFQKDIELEDKNNILVYMGDYVKAQVAEDREVVGIVTFSTELSSYIIICFETEEYFTLGESVKELIEVVGNIFDDKKVNKYG